MPKVGQIIENIHGQFAKVVEIKGSRFGLSAFVFKKEKAELETVAVTFLNSYGLSQILKPVETKKSDAPKTPKTDGTTDTKKSDAPKTDEKKAS